jgi:hypothetical protein
MTLPRRIKCEHTDNSSRIGEHRFVIDELGLSKKEQVVLYRQVVVSLDVWAFDCLRGRLLLKI